MTFSEFLDASKAMKDELTNAIKAINVEIDGVKPFGNHCFTVSLSTLNASNNWSPAFYAAYYDIEHQKERLLKELSSKTGLEEFVTRLNKFCDKGAFSDKTIVNPQFVKEVEKILVEKGFRSEKNKD